ncbi:MAG: hypothetical protein ACLQVJ_11575 [Syntrophobacteraceae bacterium]
MNSLRECYEKLKTVLGSDIEDYESVELVETYRQYWKPKDVRIILLAESHVFTNGDDRKVELVSIPSLPDYPTRYAKFVYCLAYGERQFAKTPLMLGNEGTPQFWKIFYSCGNDITSERNDFNPILKGGTSFRERIQNKIDLLLHLQQRGVWLVDACITALYNKGGKKPDLPRRLSAITASWEYCTRRVLEECAPKHIICIGREVSKMVDGDLKRIVGGNFTVIDAPNAHLSSAKHMENLLRCSELCRKLCSVGERE